MVFLSSKNIISTRPSKKLDDKRYNPFKIKALVDSLYRLDLPKTMRIHNVFHTKLLTLTATNPLPGQKNPPPESTMVNGIEEWVIDDILASKKP